MNRDRDEKLPPDPKRPPLDKDAPHLDKSKHAPDHSIRPKDKQPG